MTINGRSPGPTIYAHQGDTVIVELKNSLGTENVAIHWHGIRQVPQISSHSNYLDDFVSFFSSSVVFCVILLKIGTPWSDGTEGVTQCPILPGETFRYQFVVDRVRAGPTGFVLFISKAPSYILGLTVVNLLKCAARDLSIPCPLRYAKRRWSLWIHCGLASRRTNRAFFLRLRS